MTRYTLAVDPIKLETGLRPNSAGIPYTLLLRIEALGFPRASTVGHHCSHDSYKSRIVYS